MVSTGMRYRFGAFELVPETRELLAAGEPRAIEPQVFDLLHYLVRERDRVVSQDDLIAAVWQRRIVSDSAISARISAARAAIGDGGKRQDWIRTVPRHGFRFIGAVEPVETTQTPKPASPPETPHQRVAFCRSRDGTRIAYATSGAGYPMVKAGHWLTHLEHDWHSPLWRPLLSQLGQRFSLMRYDQRGNGLSDWSVTDFALERFVEDLEAAVDAAGLSRFALYGTSQGAPIALAYARRHPDRLSRLVLHGGFVKGRLVRSGADREQGLALLTLIRHGWGKANSPFLKAFATLFIPDGSREQIESLAELQRLTTSPDNAAALRWAFDHFDVSDLLDGIAVPTLVIHANDDGVQPLDQGRELAAQIPGAEFLLLESRNHVLVPEEPAWPILFDRLERFILSASG
jgi:DNA-binding winged helix-turn-helix (wHTH) protein